MHPDSNCAIGVFVSQTDLSLMLTTYGEISSEFDSFESGSWLLSSYILAMCVAQPLVRMKSCFRY